MKLTHSKFEAIKDFCKDRFSSFVVPSVGLEIVGPNLSPQFFLEF